MWIVQLATKSKSCLSLAHGSNCLLWALSRESVRTMPFLGTTTNTVPFRNPQSLLHRKSPDAAPTPGVFSNPCSKRPHPRLTPPALPACWPLLRRLRPRGTTMTSRTTWQRSATSAPCVPTRAINAPTPLIARSCSQPNCDRSMAMTGSVPIVLPMSRRQSRGVRNLRLRILNPWRPSLPRPPLREI